MRVCRVPECTGNTTETIPLGEQLGRYELRNLGGNRVGNSSLLERHEAAAWLDIAICVSGWPSPRAGNISGVAVIREEGTLRHCR